MATTRRNSTPHIDRATPDDMTSLVTDVGPAPAQIGAILLLDTSSGTDLDHIRATIGHRIASIPRLRQRLQPTPFGCGRPVWVDHADFDIGRHLSVADPLPAGDPDAILTLAARLVTTRLDRDRPLWAARLVPVDAGSAALVLVFHHVLADGIGGLAVLAGLVDGAPGSPLAGFPTPAPSTAQLAIEALTERGQRLLRIHQLPQRLRAAVRELRASSGTTASRASLNRPTGPRRRLAVVKGDLSAIHAAARAHGGSVNDVVLAAVAGALGSLLRSRGEEVDRFVVSIPVSRRTATTSTALGNQIGVAPAELPTLGDRHERLDVIVTRGAEIRSAPRGASTELLGPVFRLLARIGCFNWFVDRQRLVNSFVTNLRGPTDGLTLAGASITEVLPITAISGNVTVAFGVLSYIGTLAITIVADPDTAPDLGRLRDALQTELDAYALLGAEGEG